VLGNGVNSITDAEVASGRLPKSRPDHHDRAGHVEQSNACNTDCDPTQKQHGGQHMDRSGAKEKRRAGNYHWNGQQDVGSRPVEFCQRWMLYKVDRGFCLRRRGRLLIGRNLPYCYSGIGRCHETHNRSQKGQEE
jgi:hypothetical protein